MIFAVIIILMGMAWLLIETDLLRVQLSAGRVPATKTPGIAHDLSNFEPSVFVALDMPEIDQTDTGGDLNISCVRAD